MGAFWFTRSAGSPDHGLEIPRRCLLIGA